MYIFSFDIFLRCLCVLVSHCNVIAWNLKLVKRVMLLQIRSLNRSGEVLVICIYI